ncbi:hypothetical protein RJ640_020571 [Escallonia rubra]|uniref:Uncharacterized protein n=1 Tax=Escallonia rubra TaxID=112253 RepID=A0AA88QS75_9ASTE|nr:hypothetical protein RJ640_020571 [Escallonia rubra]
MATTLRETETLSPSLSPSPAVHLLIAGSLLSDFPTPKSQSLDRKVTTAKEVKAWFEERFKTGNNRWFFSKRRPTSASSMTILIFIPYHQTFALTA